MALLVFLFLFVGPDVFLLLFLFFKYVFLESKRLRKKKGTPMCHLLCLFFGSHFETHFFWSLFQPAAPFQSAIWTCCASFEKGQRAGRGGGGGLRD